MEFEAVVRLIGLVLLFATCIVAAVSDLLHRKVYNWTTFPAMFAGLAVGYLVGGVGQLPSLTGPGVGFLDHFCGLLAGFGIFYGVHLLTGGKALGLGDVKLMAAIGALTGLHFTLTAMFWGSLVGAVMAMWVLVWKGSLLSGVRRAFSYAVSLKQREAADEEDPVKTHVPYGVALSFGTIVAWFLLNGPGPT